MASPKGVFRQALISRLMVADPESESGRRKIYELVDVVIEKALDGDKDMINLIAERLDGKVQPQVAVQVNNSIDLGGIIRNAQGIASPALEAPLIEGETEEDQ